MIAVDFFCGAGGLTRGFRDAGIDVRLGIDKDPIFKETYEKNNKENNSPSVFLGASVIDVLGEDVWLRLSPDPADKIVVAACAPCQPFSVHNKKSVLKGYEDERKDLLSQMLRIVNDFERLPDYFFIENVPGFKKSGCPSYRHLKDFLKINHYSVGEDVINAAVYGVPQRRKRFILIARKMLSKQQAGELPFPVAEYGPGKVDFVTVKKTIKGLPRIGAGGKSQKYFNHHVPKLSLRNLDRLEDISKDGGSHGELSREKAVPCHLRTNGHGDTYGRMWWDRVSPTLTCKCVSISNGRFAHPTQNRAISVREAARLQTFPDDYVFYGTGITSEAKQVGNAVPVKLAEVFGRHLIKLDQT